MRILIDNAWGTNHGDAAIVEGVCRAVAVRLPQVELAVVGHELPLEPADIGAAGLSRASVSLRLRGEWMRDAPLVWRWHNVVARWSARLSLSRLGEAVGMVRVTEENQAGGLSQLAQRYSALHLAGGGFFNDQFAGGVPARLALIRAFARCGKPVTVSGQQIGPLRRTDLMVAIGRGLRRADLVGLRDDAASIEYCRRMGLGNVTVCGDDSLSVPACCPERARQLLQAHGLGGGDFLAGNFRVASYANGSSQLLGLVGSIYRQIERATGLPILFVPFALARADSDTETARCLIDQAELRGTVLDNARTPGELMGVLAQAVAAVGMSWHFCIFALTSNVPTVCINVGEYYGDKGAALASMWRDPAIHAPLDCCDVQEVVDRVRTRMNDDNRAALANRNRQLSEAHERFFDRVADVMRR